MPTAYCVLPQIYALTSNDEHGFREHLPEKEYNERQHSKRGPQQPNNAERPRRENVVPGGSAARADAREAHFCSHCWGDRVTEDH